MSKTKKCGLLVAALLLVLCVGALRLLNRTETIKAFESNAGTLTIEDDTDNIVINANVTDADSTKYQYWIKQALGVTMGGVNIDTVDDAIWCLVSQSFAKNDVQGEALYEIDGFYYVLVRAYDSSGDFLGDVFKVQEASSTTITDITLNDGEGDKAISETNYVKAGKSITLKVATSHTDSVTVTYNDKTETYSAAVAAGGVPLDIVSGNNYITIKTTGNASTSVIKVFVKGYVALDDYTFIKSVKAFNGEAEVALGENIKNAATATFEVETNINGAGSNISVLLNGETMNLHDSKYIGDITFNKYGVYMYMITVKNNDTDIVEDYYTGYYNYGREVTLNASMIRDGSSNTYNFTATVNEGDFDSEDAQYQLVRWSYAGEIVITDWLDELNQDITFMDNGAYRMEVRARGKNGGSWEIRKIFDIGDVTGNDSTLMFVDLEDDSTPIKYYAQKAYRVVAAKGYAQYKFIVSCLGQWRVEEYYSPDNSFIWIPNKEGDYTIEVRGLNEGCGYASNLYNYPVSVVLNNRLARLPDYTLMDFVEDGDIAMVDKGSFTSAQIVSADALGVPAGGNGNVLEFIGGTGSVGTVVMYGNIQVADIAELHIRMYIPEGHCYISINSVNPWSLAFDTKGIWLAFTVSSQKLTEFGITDIQSIRFESGGFTAERSVYIDSITYSLTDRVGRLPQNALMDFAEDGDILKVNKGTYAAAQIVSSDTIGVPVGATGNVLEFPNSSDGYCVIGVYGNIQVADITELHIRMYIPDGAAFIHVDGGAMDWTMALSTTGQWATLTISKAKLVAWGVTAINGIRIDRASAQGGASFYVDSITYS